MSDSHTSHSAGAGPWILGGCMALLALLGLVMASATRDDGIYAIGLLLFLINIVCIFILIGRFVGRHGRTDAGR
ncbi:MAG: hypothetical protein ACFCVH_15855 [Alphaproteobacteria bacterium]